MKFCGGWGLPRRQTIGISAVRVNPGTEMDSPLCFKALKRLPGGIDFATKRCSRFKVAHLIYASPP